MERLRRSLVVLFIPLAVLAVGLALSAISPWRQSGPLSRLQVGPDRAAAASFDSRALRCFEQSLGTGRGDNFRLQAECSVVIDGRELVVAVQHRGLSGSCSATYGGERLPCESHIPLYNSPLPAVFVRGDLGLDAATLRTLPGTNPIFAISERQWFFTQLVLAGVITLGALLLANRPQLRLSRASVGSLARAGGLTLGALLLFAGVWYALLWALLVSGLVD